MRFLYYLNWVVTICVLLLLSVSILAIFSSSRELALQQLLFGLVGFTIFALISNLDYRILNPLVKPLYILICFLLVLVVIIGVETRGSTRWIPIGPLNIQPSEFAKPIIILFLGKFWSGSLPTWRNVFKSLLLTALPAILIFKQPDLGTTLTVLAIWVGMLVMTKISLKKLTFLLIVFLVITPLAYFYLADYQKQRITSFITPYADPLGEGYNAIQSTIAVGSGQLFGRGLGYGTQSKLQFLPEYRTDFIFAAISEEFGFLGSVVILAIYGVLIFYCISLGRRVNDTFGFMIVNGVATMLLFQGVINIGMNIGLLPITGITLPLISYGGSSLIATLISLGLVCSVARLHSRVNSTQYAGLTS